MNEDGIYMSAKIMADLMKKGEEIQHIDCLISGIALVNNVNTIVTKNTLIGFRELKLRPMNKPL